MYQEFYNLGAMPFQLSPDPHFFFDSDCHHRALAYFRFGLFKGEGFLVITGEVGAGKTMLAGTLLNELSERDDVVVGSVMTSQLRADDLIRMVASSFGVKHQGLDKASILESLRDSLLELVSEEKKALLVVDDAQDLRGDALEELRILSNLQNQGRALIQIFLLGQAEFRNILNAPEMEHFRQRIVTSYHLRSLTLAETRDYILHRLRIVGWESDPLFSAEAIEKIHDTTRGVPRRINSLCDRIMLLGYLEELHEITGAVVQKAVADMQEEAYTEEYHHERQLTSGEERNKKEGRELKSADIGNELKSRINELTLRLAELEQSVFKGNGLLQEQPVELTPKGENDTHAGNDRVGQPRQGVVDIHKAAIRRTKGKISAGAPTIMCVVGARPNFMKIAPVIRALEERKPRIATCLVHTGQHYDNEMNDTFFKDLGIREPDVELRVGSGTHAVQTALIMQRFEPVLVEEAPVAVLVVGDVNSTIACALVASKHGIPVVHVEAGLRSYDRRMPEEINRVLTDQISDLLFTTEPDARDNLLREGIDERRIYYVGNVMIDNLIANIDRAIAPEEILREASNPALFTGEDAKFALLTLHRPSNVDDMHVLEQLLLTFVDVSRLIPVVFPMHPRTRKKIQDFGLEHLLLIEEERLICMPPLSYLETLGLMRNAKIVLTDSGGIQEETTALGVPCLTLRENTERPITIESGTNILVGIDRERILEAVNAILEGSGKTGKTPDLWDGKASQRIKDALVNWLAIHEPVVKRS